MPLSGYDHPHPHKATEVAAFKALLQTQDGEIGTGLHVSLSL